MKKYDIYTPKTMSKMSQSAIRKEYSRLRSIANKRIQRMTKAGLMRKQTPLFATIKEINESSKWNVESQLASVSSFLSSERTTVTGTKKFLNDFREMMTDKGYGDLVDNTENTYELIDFMEHMREQYSDKVFDSGDALDVLQETQRLRIPMSTVMEKYEEFHENMDKLADLEPPKGKKPMTKKAVDALLKKIAKQLIKKVITKI